MSEEITVYETGQGGTELVPMMVMTTAQAVARLKEFQAFVEAAMVKNVDYGNIKGIDRPTLLKPGAEKLAELYGLAPHIAVTNRIEDWDKGFFHYECKCSLVSKRSGAVVAEGLGSCNSRESRYADRWVFGSDIPDGVDHATLKSKEITSKKNNQKYKMYLWHNDDPYTLVNTILKMSKKRALIDAVLSATRSSGMFTQDVEDMAGVKVETVATPKAAPEPEPNGQAPDETPPAHAKTPERKALEAEANNFWKQVQALRKSGKVVATPPFPGETCTLDGLRDWIGAVADAVAAAA